LKLRVKAEAGELDATTSRGGLLIKTERDQHATTAMLMPSEDNLLEVPPSKAILADFPPGSAVLFADTRVMPISVCTVQNVFLDLTPGCSREYLYKISVRKGTQSLIVREMELQWASQCPVWLQPLQEGTGGESRAAVILGSYQSVERGTPLYSVQEVQTGTGIFHGVTKDCIRYRPVGSDNGRQQVTQSAMAELTHYEREHEQPAAVPSALVPISSLRLPDSHNIKTPASKTQDTIASRVTSSPRKRPSPSEHSTSLNDADPTTGSCIAEFRLPSWMKVLCLDGTCVLLILE